MICIPLPQSLYVAFRVYYLWESFSGWHQAGFALLLVVQLACWAMFSSSATPKYASLQDGGKLISGGVDLSQGGIVECVRGCRTAIAISCFSCRAHTIDCDSLTPHLDRYTWDMLYITLFVQLGSGFISDWFWVFYLIPPGIGLYFLWTKVIYPWISRPDAEAEPVDPNAKKEKVKYRK